MNGIKANTFKFGIESIYTVAVVMGCSILININVLARVCLRPVTSIYLFAANWLNDTKNTIILNRFN